MNRIQSATFHLVPLLRVIRQPKKDAIIEYSTQDPLINPPSILPFRFTQIHSLMEENIETESIKHSQ
jgi:hypothetical protein